MHTGVHGGYAEEDDKASISQCRCPKHDAVLFLVHESVRVYEAVHLEG